MFSFGENHGWLNKEIRENLKGGLTMIFKRVAQTFSEPGIDSAAWTVPNGNPGRILLFQDVNSLYPTTMRQALPVGRPVVYTRESEEIGFKREKFYNDGSNASENSFKWLNEMQQYFSEKIQTALSGVERKIGDFSLDGFVVQDGRKIGLDYNGCRFHPCGRCKTKFVGSAGDRARANNRTAFLKANLDEYITISECDFLSRPNYETSLLTCFFAQKTVSDAEFISAVKTGRFKGIAKVDIKTPEAARQKYLKWNFPPLAVKRVVTKDMVYEKLRAKFEKFDSKPQLTLGFDDENTILCSDLLKYYLENGLQITKIHYFVEYNHNKVFQPFIDRLVQRRIQATKNGNKPQEQLSKLLMNSSWGRLAMNLSKRENVVYCRDVEIPKHRNILLKSIHAIETEFPIDLYELKKHKKSQTDRIPVLTALTILQLSKLHMILYLEFLYKFMREGSWALCYMDTDSFLFHAEDRFENLVKPELREEFEREKYIWFLRDQSAEEKRRPGKVCLTPWALARSDA